MSPYTWLALGGGIGLVACGWMLTSMAGRDADGYDTDDNGPIEAAMLSAIGITLICVSPFLGWLA